MVNFSVPRDSLGRIIYPGDTIYVEGFRKRSTPVEASGMALLACRAIKSEIFTVDLDASPDHTNYERYFADLGTFREIIVALNNACSLCEECVFDDWGEAFNIKNCLSCGSFTAWLIKEATI